MAEVWKCPVCYCDDHERVVGGKVDLVCNHTLCLHCCIEIYKRAQALPLCPLCREPFYHPDAGKTPADDSDMDSDTGLAWPSFGSRHGRGLFGSRQRRALFSGSIIMRDSPETPPQEGEHPFLHIMRQAEDDGRARRLMRQIGLNMRLRNMSPLVHDLTDDPIEDVPFSGRTHDHEPPDPSEIEGERQDVPDRFMGQRVPVLPLQRRVRRSRRVRAPPDHETGAEGHEAKKSRSIW